MKQVLNSKSYYFNELYVCEFSTCSEVKHNIVLFHGFPGWATKNYDVAESLAMLGARCFVPHYSGLGFSKGKFGFAKSIKEMGMFIENISSKLPIQIIGHSWGGFVGLSLIDHISDLFIGMAPLCSLPEGDEDLRRLVETVVQSNSYLFDEEYGIQEIFKELIELRNNLNEATSTIHSRDSLNIKIIHGVNDSVVSVNDSREFATRFKEKVTLVENDCEHLLLSNRPSLLEQISDWVFDD